MKRAIFLLGLCSALLLPAGAWADIALPGVPRRPRVPPPIERPLADVKVQSGTGGLRLEFQLAGSGECAYTLRGPQSESDPGPVAATGSLTADDTDMQVEKVAIAPAPEENVTRRYRLEALCRVKATEQTNFGAKETGQVKEVRLTRTFNLRRESVYRVTQ